MTMNRQMFDQRDLRSEPLYKEVEGFFRALHNPGQDFISDAAEISASPCGRFAGFSGTVFNDMASAPVSYACVADLARGDVIRIAHKGNNDRYVRWAPDGSRLAFLSDRAGAGNFQLCLAGGDGTGEVETTPVINGVVEHIHWSPDSRHILMVVAGFGADMAGYQGGAKTVSRSDDLPDWLPRVESGDAANLWRWLEVYDVPTGKTRKVSPEGLNTWEGGWLGPARILAIASNSHVEGSWYTSRLYTIDLDSGRAEPLYTPADQIGMPTASPDGRYVALIEAVCSDRGIVCGNLKMIDPETGAAKKIDTQYVDVTHLVWRNENELAYVGHRSFETVTGDVDASSGKATENWASMERVLGPWYPFIWPLPDGGVVGVAQAYNVPPELVILKEGGSRTVRSFASEATKANGFCTSTIEPVRWKAPDGLEIHGLLVKPKGEGPFPLVMDIHGGPVWACPNRWMGYLRGCKLLADKGYASLYPNPRGSSCRGIEFARLVQGDMGGADTYDYLSGIDYLVQEGIVDPDRVGVTGISYGGFMSAWLITQDQRFAAAVPISPVTDWYSQHWTSQIPFFDELMLKDGPRNPNGKRFQRSPVMHTDKVRTPTLQLVGDLDQNTPPTQGLEFHRALLENGVETICTFYPKAGHGIRSFPSVIDHTTRKIGWFLLHMAPDEQASPS